eukprot:1677386-Prymnesium_polylepis.1
MSQRASSTYADGSSRFWSLKWAWSAREPAGGGALKGDGSSPSKPSRTKATRAPCGRKKADG